MKDAVNSTTELSSSAVAPGKKRSPSKPEKIRAELNIEKWPAIWQPSSSKSKPVSRVLERQVELNTGERVTSRLEVGFTQHGTVTTEDQKMFYALVKQWEDSGKPTSLIYFSDRLLQRLLKKTWGSNVLDAITGSLRRLRTTPFTWTRSFHQRSDAETRAVEEETFFTLLADLKIVRRKTDGHVTNQQGYFQFDKNILDNLLSSYTKPLYLDDLFRFKSEVAQLLYVHVDLILANKTSYERKTKELFDDLGLRGHSYRYPSNRKQVLTRAIKELQGARLSTGVLKAASLELTADKQDYKVVFRKGASPAIDEETDKASDIGRALEGSPVVVNNYAKLKDPLIADAGQLVAEFYKLFHGVERHVAQSKETSQALSLLSQYGKDKALHVIHFAKTAAEQTSFHIQTFGGTLQYTSRALADYDRTTHRSEQPAQAASQARTAQIRDCARGRKRLNSLTAEQYCRRFEAAKAEISGRPYLTGKLPGSKLFEAAVRRQMIETLETEPMELTVFDPDLLATYPWLTGSTQNFAV